MELTRKLRQAKPRASQRYTQFEKKIALLKFVHHININKDAKPRVRIPAGITEGWKYVLTLTNKVEF